MRRKSILGSWWAPEGRRLAAAEPSCGPVHRPGGRGAFRVGVAARIGPGGYLLSALLVLVAGALAEPDRAVAADDGLGLSAAGFRIMGLAEGLPDPQPTCLLQDRHGFLWVGTENGLSRFDGFSYQSFHHRPGDERSLASDRILTLYESRSGELWVGTAVGACRFEASHLTFECYPSMAGLEMGAGDGDAGGDGGDGAAGRADDSPDASVSSTAANGGEAVPTEAVPEASPVVASPVVGSVADLEVVAIAEEARGRIWIATGAGLGRLDTGQSVPRLEISTSSADTDWTGGRILALAVHGERLWIGAEGGLFGRDESGTLRHYRLDSSQSPSTIGTAVEKIRVDGGDRLWVANAAGLARLVDPEVGTFASIPVPGVVDFGFDGDELWIARRSGELIRRLASGEMRSHALSDPGEQGASSAIRALRVDAEGRIWVAIAGVGVALRDSEVVARQSVVPGAVLGARGASGTRALAADADGRLWIGRTGGIEALDRSGRILGHAFPASAGPVSGSTAVPEIVAIDPRPGDPVWVGTRQRGPWVLDPESGSFSPVPTWPSEATGAIVAIVGRDRHRFVATEAGVWRIGETAVRIPIREHGERTGVMIRSPGITDLEMDSEGGLWATTLGGLGLLHLAPGEQAFRALPMAEEIGDRSRMHSLAIATDGTIWIATDQGLSSYDRSKERYRVRPAHRALVDRRLSDLDFDTAGDLWALGVENLYRITMENGAETAKKRMPVDVGAIPETRKVVVAMAGAVPGSEDSFAGGRMAILGDRIYVGTARGLVAFDAKALEPRAPRGPVLVGLKLDGERIEPRSLDPDSPLIEAMTELDRLELEHRHGQIGLELVGLEYGAPSSTAFLYRLDGLHQDWRTAEAGRGTITYPQLSPGRYLFEVWSINRAGERSAKSARLRIVIEPPWWSSPLARITYLVFGLAFGVALASRARARFARTRALDQRLQEAQSQKLESLSTLAGGVAHDFNNLLVGIFGHAELARMEVEDGSRMALHLDQIEKAASRAADLSRQMLFYSGRGNFVVEPLDLSALVGAVAEETRSGLAPGVRLLVEIEPRLPPIEGDSGQLRQLLVSLINNAAESLVDREGFIVVATGVMHCDKEFVGAGQADNILPPGDYVFLTVDDTGAGIEPADIPKIFDPFFSTKSPGRGLGLAATQGIVRGHGGAMQVSSTVSRGSTFRVLFPVVAKTELPAQGELRRSTDPGAGSRGLVLVVDDEKTVRLVAAEYLERLGFKVLQAVDGKQAIEIFAREHGHLSLVLLDLNMPGMDGVQTYREMRQLDTAVPVVLSTGFTEEDATQRLGGDRPQGFIEKPYRLAQLEACVGSVLDAEKVGVG